MKKQDRSGYAEIAGIILKKTGLMLLKLLAFVLWVVLSGIDIMLRHSVDSIKKWLFPKD